MENFAVELANLSRTDGSALLSIGETVVQAAVYGPCDVSVSKELYDKALLEVNFRPKLGQSSCAERLSEAYIKLAIEASVMTDLYPRTSIQVILQEIQDDGNLLACCVNAAVLALNDAGLPLKYMASSVTGGIHTDGHIITFPTIKEQENCSSVITWSFGGSEEEVTNVFGKSAISEVDLHNTLASCRMSSRDVQKFFYESMKQRYLKAEDNETI